MSAGEVWMWRGERNENRMRKSGAARGKLKSRKKLLLSNLAILCKPPFEELLPVLRLVHPLSGSSASPSLSPRHFHPAFSVAPPAGIPDVQTARGASRNSRIIFARTNSPSFFSLPSLRKVFFRSLAPGYLPESGGSREQYGLIRATVGRQS